MPKQALRPCQHHGCPQLVRRRRYCPAHAKEHAWSSTVGSSSARGYGAQHRRQREALLRRKPMCAECVRQGLVGLATHADHIIPLSRGGLRTAANLQGLCARHHAEKTRRESMTAKREAAERRKHRFG